MAFDTKILGTKAYIAKTVSSGVLTLDEWGYAYYVDGEGSVADDIVTISMAIESQPIIIKAKGVALKLKHGTGNIQLSSGADFVLPAECSILLMFDGTNWRDLVAISAENYVPKSMYDADSIIAATTDNNPVVIAMAEKTIIGRAASGHPAALTAAQALALIFSASLPENTAIMFEDVLSADGKYTGIVMEGTAGAALAFGDVCYLQASDARWELADNDSASTATNMLGICVLAAGADGEATKMLILGTIRADSAFPDVTKGAPVYLDSTPGDLTSTLPAKATGRIVRILGYGWYTANEIFFNPEKDWIKYA